MFEILDLEIDNEEVQGSPNDTLDYQKGESGFAIHLRTVV